MLGHGHCAAEYALATLVREYDTQALHVEHAAPTCVHAPGATHATTCCFWPFADWNLCNVRGTTCTPLQTRYRPLLEAGHLPSYSSLRLRALDVAKAAVGAMGFEVGCPPGVRVPKHNASFARRLDCPDSIQTVCIVGSVTTAAHTAQCTARQHDLLHTCIHGVGHCLRAAQPSAHDVMTHLTFCEKLQLIQLRGVSDQKFQKWCWMGWRSLVASSQDR